MLERATPGVVLECEEAMLDDGVVNLKVGVYEPLFFRSLALLGCGLAAGAELGSWTMTFADKNGGYWLTRLDGLMMPVLLVPRTSAAVAEGLISGLGFFSACFLRISTQFGQYHLPLGAELRPTQVK